MSRPADPGKLTTAPPFPAAESVGTGQKNGADSRARKSGAGWVSVIVSWSPLARSPLTWGAFPARKGCSPSMFGTMKEAGGWSPSFGDSARSMEKR